MRCALCGGTGPRRRVVTTPEGDLTRCPRCGLVAVDPMPGAAEALRLYDAEYFRDPVRGYLDYAADEPAFRSEFRRRLRAILRLRRGGRLLEVGSATGAFLREAAAAGFEVLGVEPSAAAAAGARDLPVLVEAVEDASLPAGAFDVVVAFEVLEHLTDPVAVLRRLGRALAPGGLLAASVPDSGSLWARLAGRRWPLLTPWEHLHYFTRRTLRGALEAAGFAACRFEPCRTVFSAGTLAFHLGIPPAALPRGLAHRGVALPFGTLLALARAAPPPEGRGGPG